MWTPLYHHTKFHSHMVLEIGLTIFSDIFEILSIIQRCAIGRSLSSLLHRNGEVPLSIAIICCVIYCIMHVSPA